MTTLRIPMRRAAAVALLVAAGATAGVACAQPAEPMQPIVTVSASATVTVTNDRLQAWLRAEAENPSPAAAASQVNAIITKALAGARSYPAVKLATAGYSTQQISEKGKPSRWHVAQAVSLDSADFTTAAVLITKLQDEDELLLSGMGFSLSDKTRARCRRRVTRQAIRSWQSRADQAAQALASPAGGRTSDRAGRRRRREVYPTMRRAGLARGLRRPRSRSRPERPM
jgi:predicted secreted protein